MRPRCAKHQSPMFEEMDAFNFQVSHYCRACDYAKKAKSYYALASKAMSVGNETCCTQMTEKAQIAEANERETMGRWFEVKRNGMFCSMSEVQIEMARYRRVQVEVLTEIV